MSNNSRRGAAVVCCTTTLWLMTGIAALADSADPSKPAAAGTTPTDATQGKPGTVTPTDAKPTEATPTAEPTKLQSSDAKPMAGKTTWTTYLYQGPSYRYSVIGEVPQTTIVDVGACADDWCKVRYDDRIGYVRSNVVAFGSLAKPGDGVLGQPAAAVSPMPPSGRCFTANQTSGNGGNAMTRFCEQ